VSTQPRAVPSVRTHVAAKTFVFFVSCSLILFPIPISVISENQWSDFSDLRFSAFICGERFWFFLSAPLLFRVDTMTCN
jgi:hypothetical protein